MKLLTPVEVLQALQVGEELEYKHQNFDEWSKLDRLNNGIVLENIFNGFTEFRLAQEMITFSKACE